MNIAVLGTLDTKGTECLFVADQLQAGGCRPILIDVSTTTSSGIQADITRAMVLEAAGSEDAVFPNDRGPAVALMTELAARAMPKLAVAHRIAGIISLGGTGGTAIGTAAMRALPIGIPKVMVSTVASGNTAPYVDISDIIMMPAIVDVSGLNRISRNVFAKAAAAVVAMARTQANSLRTSQDDRPIITASMFGNTTKCVEHARRLLEEEGYEVMTFHATGIGGRTMESLIASGMITGVLDITTTEWADELVGGILNAGPMRLEAAARSGTPAVVVPGCLDMVNFGPRRSVPERFEGRLFYEHNPQITLMRTTPDECNQLGTIIADKLNHSIGPVCVLIPLRGISVISAPGGPFFDPVADEALFSALRGRLRRDIELIEMDCNINDPGFAERCTERLTSLAASRRS